jgi:hypothetical protein
MTRFEFAAFRLRNAPLFMAAHAATARILLTRHVLTATIPVSSQQIDILRLPREET